MAKRPRRLRAQRQQPLDPIQILAWADAYHARTGRWPTCQSGRIPETTSGTWAAVDRALRTGYRGLPGGSSLPALLAENRGVPYQPRHDSHERLTIDMILEWADAHHARHGCWPGRQSG